jgi:ribosomal protein S20
MKSSLKKLRLAISEKNQEKAKSLLPEVQSTLAKLSGSGHIKPNKAARITSRLSSQINSI